MRKWGVTVASAVGTVFLLVSVSSAIEVGNLPTQQGGRVEVKYDHAQREVEMKDDISATIHMDDVPGPGWGPGTKQRLRIGEFSGEEILDRGYIKASYAPTDIFGIALKGGVARLRHSMFDSHAVYQDRLDSGGAFSVTLDDWLMHAEGKGDWGPFFGIGATVVVHKSDSCSIGFDLQYNWQEMDSETIISDYSYGVFSGTGRTPDSGFYQRDTAKITKTTTQEAQLALVISRKLGNFSPYGGAKVSWYETRYEGTWNSRFTDYDIPSNSYDKSTSFEAKTEPQDYVGLFFGMDYEFFDNIVLNGEIRVGDETAMNVGLGIRF